MDSIEKLHQGKTAEGYFETINTDLVEKIPDHPGKILDIGCAAGKLGEDIIKIKHPETYEGIEVVRSVAEMARKYLDEVYVGQAEEWLPQLSTASYDWVIMADSLEHTVDPWDILREVNRILKNDGHVLVSLPNVRNLGVVTELLVKGTWNYKDMGILDRGHLRFFTKRNILKMLREHGFEPELIYSNPRNRWKKFRGRFVSRCLSFMIGKPSDYEEFITVQWRIVAKKVKEIY